MIYQVWLHARHPKTLETVATVRVYAHDDRLRAERVLETAQADFQPLVLELLRAHPGALVNAEMRHGDVPDYRALLVRYMAAVIDAESVSYVGSYQGYEIKLTEDEKRELLIIEKEAFSVPADK